MKIKTIAFLTALLLVVLAGCNNAPLNEDKPQPFSFSESVQSTPESELYDGAKAHFPFNEYLLRAVQAEYRSKSKGGYEIE